MIQKLQSALSTIHATVLAVIEVPDALKKVVEFARESGAVCEITLLKSELASCRESSARILRELGWRDPEFPKPGMVTREIDKLFQELDVEKYVWRMQWDWAKERIKSLQSSVSDWHGKHKDVSRQLASANNELQRLGRELTEARHVPEDTECEDYPEGPKTWRRAWKMLKKERGKWRNERAELQTTINETRELLSSLSSYLGYGLGGENESLASMIERVETGIKHHLGVTSTMIGDLQSKLARYEAAEKWHQVTSGEGELPPPIPVLWRNNHPDFPLGELNFSIQGACGTYEWRFLSNEDVPNV